jgi:hypothetical protein
MLNANELRQHWDTVKRADTLVRAQRVKEVDDYFEKLRLERTKSYGESGENGES